MGCSSENNDPVSITMTDEDGSTSVDETTLTDVLDDLPLEQPDVAETAGLLFMREEEKLAHDVYIKMFAEWNTKVFESISNSEQTHTDAILTLLERYSIDDPVGSNGEGTFVDQYLQNLYDTLVAQGQASLIDALYVGAEIEELDLIDIQDLADALVGNEDIKVVYENLMKGSRNHLRSFVSNLEKQGVTYVPQHLSQQVYDDIINSDIEN
ncbi:MAG: DUF2202 domain-containing protein [Gammaproteobacteria bacterium]|nr:DUF2202 domain-containing protein [Gammaproteobacteria bacterium]